MATSHRQTELFADEYTNGEPVVNEEAAKTQTPGDEIVTDAISEIKEIPSKSKKGKRNKDFDLDFDVEDELNKVENEVQELKPKSRGAKPQIAKQDDKEATADPLGEGEESAALSKTQKKKKKKKPQSTVEEINTDQQINEDSKDITEPTQESESAAGKKAKTKKQRQGPSQAVREQLRQALREQEERERERREEEERKGREFETREEERLAKVERERLRKEKKKTQRKDRISEQKLAGTYVTKEQKDRNKERQDKASAMQQAYGMTVGPSDVDTGCSKVKYGARKRNRNREETEDTLLGGEADSSETSALKTESADQLERGRDSWEDMLGPQLEETGQKQSVKDNWEDSDTSYSEDSSTDESEPINEISVPNQSIETLPKENTTTTTATLPNQDTPVTRTGTNNEVSSDSETDLSSYDLARNRIINRREQANEARNKSKLRSPILCVLGHVDTGKTKILDKIRHTSVQDGEAGGITQQIGATFVPADIIRVQTSFLKEFTQKTEVLLPGLLIIDTPGHESFRNLRSRGSSLCDIAILVVDIMHGLEPQTIESINLLKKKKCKFIIALNKVDRLYDWRRSPHSSIKDGIKKQKRNTADHFNERLVQIKLELNTQGLNVALFWEKFNFDEYIPMVPTSAITGDGMGDLMAMMVLVSQKFLINQLMWSAEVEATVMEVKVTPGYGHTLDVVLKNGVVKEGDTIVLFGTEGPIVTQIRAILTPQPMKEMRVKGEFIHHQMIDNTQGIKIAGKELEFAIASSPVLVPVKQDEVPVLVDQINSEMQAALTDFKLKDKGVYVQSSTLGSMEALLEFLKTSKIPYSGINIGPVHRKDVIRCSTMLQHDAQYAVILAFDVRIDKDALELSDQLGIKIFTADIIYHLFDNFMAHRKDYAEKMKSENRHLAVYPVRLSIVPNCVFNSRDPLVMGVRIEEGMLMTGTPIYVPNKEVDIGIITSIEINHKPVEKSRKGVEVCVKIETPPGDTPKMFERHFGYEDELVSKISRGSIDTMKNFFKDELIREDWELIVQLKKTFGIF